MLQTWEVERVGTKAHFLVNCRIAFDSHTLKRIVVICWHIPVTLKAFHLKIKPPKNFSGFNIFWLESPENKEACKCLCKRIQTMGALEPFLLLIIIVWSWQNGVIFPDVKEEGKQKDILASHNQMSRKTKLRVSFNAEESEAKLNVKRQRILLHNKNIWKQSPERDI